jgi:phage terminase large subunit GpA-like protein
MLQTHPSALTNIDAAIARTSKLWEPPPDLTVSEWAMRNRYMPKGTTSRPGPFVPEKFQVEMMDAILNPRVHEIVIQKCTQVGFSDGVLNNIIGYYIEADPKPIMLVQPTIDNAKDYGKKRIAPMIENCPVLRDRIKDPTSRRPGNTLALKEFPGGFLKLTGANTGAGLRSDPVPIVLFDEVDGYPLDVEGEGDPLEIGTRRTDTYADYKIVKGSTPSKPKSISRIERDFERSDKRRFFVPCPFCQFMQILWWRDPQTKEYRLYFERDQGGQIVKETVAFVCANCKQKIAERFKHRMLNAGEWRPEFPSRPVVGFHLNALYSPWRDNWNDLAQEWNDATTQKNPEKLKAFINLRLGETWEEEGDSVEALGLKSRLEPQRAEVPAGVGVLTASVDVQGDRLEIVVKGWGAGEESWLIAYQTLFGDPGQTGVWDDLDGFLGEEFQHQSGRMVKIAATMIDSGGLHTEEVYRFCKARAHRRIYCLKGSSETGKEILGRFTTNNRYQVKLFTCGTDTAKDRIFARLRIAAPGPGYVHLPEWAEDEYLAQLTAEKAIRRYKRGRGIVREYVKMRARNEALDLEVYALAALYVLGHQALRRLGELAAELNLPPDTPQSGTGGPGEGGPAQGGPRSGKRSGWVYGYDS